MPGHVGLILGGNRHHVIQIRLRCTGLALVLHEVLEWCADLGIKLVPLWVLSPDNLKRSPEETSSILATIESRMRRLCQEPEIHLRKVKV